MHRLPENMALLTLRQGHLRNKKILVLTTPFADYKSSDIFSQFNKNDPLSNLWLLFSEARMNRIPENMFLLTLRQDHFSIKKFLLPTPPLIDFKKSNIFTQFNKNDPI